MGCFEDFQKALNFRREKNHLNWEWGKYADSLAISRAAATLQNPESPSVATERFSCLPFGM